MIGKILGILLLLAFVYALIEYRTLKITALTAQNFTEQAVPKAMQGKKILFASDFQYANRLGTQKRLIRHVVRKMAAEKADIILFGGDFIHSVNTHNDFLFTELKTLTGQKLAVLGNHDNLDSEYVKTKLSDSGIQLLENETMSLHGIAIQGVADLRSGQPKITAAEKKFSIFLAHNPDTFETSQEQFTILLAGHLHGGQITLFGRFAPIALTAYGQKYIHGFVASPMGMAYVSSGLGGYVLGLPLRFFAQPELVTIQF